MGRLIDADAFLQSLINYNIGRKGLEEVIKAIREQPTAYDLDNVAKKLEGLAEENHNKATVFAGHDDQSCGCAASAAAAYEQAIEIMKVVE